MTEVEPHPGEPAAVSGVFHETNVFGTRTGRTAQIEAGNPLPDAPVGFHWVLPEDATYHDEISILHHGMVENDTCGG